MKKYFICILIVAIAFGCGKKAPVPDVEENIVFDVNVSQAVISTSSSYDFKVTIKSKLPKAGIRIEVSATEEAGGASVSPQLTPVNSTAAITDCVVQNLPRQKWVIVNVKITSLTTSTNTSAQTFRIFYK